MNQSFELGDFLTPLDMSSLFGDVSFDKFQLGSFIDKNEDQLPDLNKADVIIVGIEEFRGGGYPAETASADAVRKQLYSLYQWQPEVGIADLGNIQKGKSLKDSRAALKMVLEELLSLGKRILILGGSHDLTLTQYQAYVSRKQVIEATVVDALIDLHEEEYAHSRRFLMEMLTGQPNYVKHYNHIGFQSYFVHPRMLETLDKLRFDCYRLGTAREELHNLEPVIRSSDLFSFDITALRSGDAPASRLSPNGFAGEEACALFKYAGMSNQLTSIGLYGFIPENDRDELTAIQAAEMIWYFIEGVGVSLNEANLDESTAFTEFHITIDDADTAFLKSKNTGRWWMKMPNKKIYPCAYEDYVTAGKGEIPERWLRVQERM